MTDMFRSARLIYRGVENPEDLPIFEKLVHDRIGWSNSNGGNIELGNKSTAKIYMEFCAEKALLGAVICLPPAVAEAKPEAVPVGVIHLRGSSKTMYHNRTTDIGIQIFPEFQGQGYGTESIKWITRYAFHHAGLHRVSIGSFEFNTGASKLYEKCGFKHEGRSREAVWHNGRFWDIFNLGMLAHEWEEQQREEEVKGKDAS